MEKASNHGIGIVRLCIKHNKKSQLQAALLFQSLSFLFFCVLVSLKHTAHGVTGHKIHVHNPKKRTTANRDLAGGHPSKNYASKWLESVHKRAEIAKIGPRWRINANVALPCPSHTTTDASVDRTSKQASNRTLCLFLRLRLRLLLFLSHLFTRRSIANSAISYVKTVSNACH